MATARDEEAMTATHILTRAAYYIRRHGWTQRTEVNARGHVCALEAISRVTPKGDVQEEARAMRDACTRLRAYLAVESIADWNDEPTQTRAAVIRALRAAAAPVRTWPKRSPLPPERTARP